MRKNIVLFDHGEESQGDIIVAIRGNIGNFMEAVRKHYAVQISNTNVVKEKQLHQANRDIILDLIKKHIPETLDNGIYTLQPPRETETYLPTIWQDINVIIYDDWFVLAEEGET